MTRTWHRFDPRHSALPVLLVFLGGILMHSVDQVLNFRAGPLPILVTAPSVAALAYLYYRPDVTARHFGVLIGWGVVGTGLAILGVYLHATSYQLPRAMTEPEMVLYDLGMFLWFVLALTGAYASGARIIEQDRYRLAAILTGPILQLGWGLVVVLLVEIGVYV